MACVQTPCCTELPGAKAVARLPQLLHYSPHANATAHSTRHPSPPPPTAAGFNTLLRYMPPLIITLGCNMEPLLGSLLGWVAGVMAPPGAWTYGGGVLVMASTVAVTLAAHYR
jgi:hypothetical protein